MQQAGKQKADDIAAGRPDQMAEAAAETAFFSTEADVSGLEPGFSGSLPQEARNTTRAADAAIRQANAEKCSKKDCLCILDPSC